VFSSNLPHSGLEERLFPQRDWDTSTVPILPVVDSAVLGSPDNDSQELTDEAHRYQELVAHANI
jgi:hypothetical protein